MQIEELEKMAFEAKARYDTLCEIMKGIMEKLDDRFIKEKFDGHPEFFCFDFETLYQFALLNISCNDKTLDYNEIVFLRLLAEGHSSLEIFLDEAAKRDDSRARFCFENLTRMSLKEIHNYLNDLYKKWFEDENHLMIDALQSLDNFNTRQYYQIFRECTLEIVNALLWIDHHSNQNEYERAMEYIDNLFLLPLRRITILEGKYNPLELKKICQDGRHYKSLLELFKIRSSLYERKQGFRVNYIQHQQLLENALIYIETDKSTGSGFIIGEKGLCITCAHVVQDSKYVFARVTLENGRKEIHKCHVLFVDNNQDFALIRLETPHHYYFDYEKSYQHLGLGHEIAIVGYPFGVGLSDNVMELSPTLTKGYISSKQIKDRSEFYFLDAAARPGNSGGPVFDARNGKVIGYLCGAYGDGDNKIVFMHSLELYVDKLAEMLE